MATKVGDYDKVSSVPQSRQGDREKVQDQSAVKAAQSRASENIDVEDNDDAVRITLSHGRDSDVKPLVYAPSHGFGYGLN